MEQIKIVYKMTGDVYKSLDDTYNYKNKILDYHSIKVFFKGHLKGIYYMIFKNELPIYNNICNLNTDDFNVKLLKNDNILFEGEFQIVIFNYDNSILSKLHSTGYYYHQDSIFIICNLNNLSDDIKNNRLLMTAYYKNNTNAEILDIYKDDTEFMKNNTKFFSKGTDSIKTNMELIKFILKYDTKSIKPEYLPIELYDDENIMKNLCVSYPETMTYISERLNNDKDFILSMISLNFKCFKYLKCEHKNNINIIIKSLNANKKQYKPKFSKNINIMNTYAYNNDTLFSYLNENFRDDDKIALLAIQSNYDNITHISNRLKNDKNFIMNLLKSYPFIYRHISSDLKKDMDIVKYIINLEPSQIRYFEDILKDIDLVINIAQEYPNIYKYLPLEFLKNKELAKIIIEINIELFNKMDKSLKNDIEFVGELIEINKNVIYFISSKILSNNNFIYKYVKKYPEILLQINETKFSSSNFINNLILLNGECYNYIPHKYMNPKKMKFI